MCTSNQSQRRVFTSDSRDMVPADLARYCGTNGFTRDQQDVPSAPTPATPGLSPKELAALKKLAAVAPELVAMAKGQAPNEEEHEAEDDALPSAGNASLPARTLDGGRGLPLGWDIYTDSRHLQSVAADDAEWAD